MKSVLYLIAVFAIVCSVPFLMPYEARAGEAADQWVSKIVSIQGEAFVKRMDGAEWQPVVLNDTFFPGDALRLAANSRAALVLSNESTLRVDQYTTLVFTGIEQKKTFLMELLEGAAYLFSRKARSLKVATPFVNGVVEGTEFYVRVDVDKSTIILYEGGVLAQNRFGDVTMAKGQAVVAEAGRAPRLEIIARPRDAVQWALYYPPIIAFRADDFPVQDSDHWTTQLHHSIQNLHKGDPTQAFAAIDGLGDTVGDPRFYTYRAGLRLSVGRIKEARSDLKRALDLDRNNSAALALRAVMAVVQNRKENALMDARLAVNLDPQSAAARVALSYVQQAQFDLASALASAQAATTSEPENGVAWARLAELYLSTGDLDQALAAAQKATVLSPGLAHVQSVQGYAYLTQIKIDKAKATFDQAIRLDSAAPLPRLGLGLAKIRDGRLKEGRAEIEIAVGLDPDNALLRSYLGKAYFDEKRDGLDERQFEMAKQLDPNDPTPWFYDAIRKQTLNRPGEALQDMQKAIELNDNRAVYRSRLLLDEDLAARSASLGRIYNDLSFEELALREGAKSLDADPANYSAHRLLSDMYASRPRHEIARVSELLQSQLLQPLNLTPVQPQLAESNLLIAEGGGPGNLSFSEYNPLFTRNRTDLQLDGVAGELETYGGDATLAGLHDWFSYSAGYYHFETEGYRENNDLTKDIYDILTQVRVSEKASFQLEYRQRKTDNGDLRQRFDLQDYRSNWQQVREEKIPRLGFYYQPTANHHLIASLIYNQTDYQHDYDSEGSGFLRIYDTAEEVEAYNGELQYQFNKRILNMTAGAGYYDQSTDGYRRLDYLLDNGTLYPGLPEVGETKARHSNAYTYFNFTPLSTVKTTIGLSGDNFDKDRVEMHQWNPKFGLAWQPISKVLVRAAAFRTLKRSLVTNQTIEPTQVAGFNQFFDDPTGADAKRYRIGVDYSLMQSLKIGVEATYGDLIYPITLLIGEPLEVHRDEWIHSAYLYWLLNPQWAMNLEYRYEEFGEKVDLIRPDPPRNIQAHFVPLTLSFFHPLGIFSKIKAQYIHQALELYNIGIARYEKDHEDIVSVDASLGYRLPRRIGVLSLEVTNVFDEDFHYYDVNIVINSTQTTSIKPCRQVLFKATFSF